MAKQTLIQRSRRVSPAEKATFHVLNGAGKAGTIRDFFGLTSQDEQTIEDEIGAQLDVNLRREG